MYTEHIFHAVYSFHKFPRVVRCVKNAYGRLELEQNRKTGKNAIRQVPLVSECIMANIDS